MLDRRGLVVVAALMLLLAACSGGDGDTTTTTGSAPGSTAPGGDSTTTVPGDPPATGAASTTTTVPGSTTTSTTPADPTGLPSYTIEARQPDPAGDTVVVLLPPGTYDDVGLEELVIDVLERFAPIATIHVVDDRTAVPLVLADSDTLAAAEVAVLDEHYLVRLEDGFRMVFVGPFTGLGEMVIGS